MASRDSSSRRPRRAAIAGLVVGSVAAAGIALGVAIPRGGDSDAAAPVQVVAAAPATHTAAAHTTAAEATVPDAPKNTQTADAPAYEDQRVHRVSMDMLEKNFEIAPGKVVKLWTFGPRVPGPVIRVRVGDTVEATIVNKGSIEHSIDFHAARIAPNRAFRNVKPGERFTFSFKVTTPGVFMYHCGTAPVVHHIANGMYGMIIVEPKEGLPPVDRELAFVQSDFYVSDTPGTPADNTKLMNVEPDVVAFNGYAGQYKDTPIRVKKGERIRAFVLAAGPNTWSAFHVVGTIFDRAWIDGIHPENLAIGNQTLNLSASQGAVAEFRLDEEGVYPFVTHDFTNATKGAVGLFATEHAEVPEGGGH
ncbi:MAG: multicopper oxidase domain-containing protein [Thermoleophilia bacterium]|jgi:nitrite reductase (NO-forming)|nr:multicopper oxidase domain-containing protein [Thermoleophilia bacterium]